MTFLPADLWVNQITVIYHLSLSVDYMKNTKESKCWEFVCSLRLISYTHLFCYAKSTTNCISARLNLQTKVIECFL